MLRSKCITWILFLTFPVGLNAQYDDLLRNPKISWVAEYTTDYELNPVYNDQLDAEYNLLQLIRLQALPESTLLHQDTEINFPFFFSRLLYNGLDSSLADRCYADMDLSALLAPPGLSERITRSDTVVVVDPQTIENRIITAQSPLPPEDFPLFRLRQVLYYDASKQQFGSRLLALAPVREYRDTTGLVLRREPVCWIRMPQPGKRQARALESEAGYAVQTFTKDNTPDWTDLQVVKGRLELKKWLQAEIDHPKHAIQVPDEGAGFRTISKQALDQLVYSRDTVTAINKLGISTIAGVVEKTAVDQVEKLRLVQNWYYDPVRKVLYGRLIAVAPMATIRDSEGRPRYDKPLFYIKY